MQKENKILKHCKLANKIQSILNPVMISFSKFNKYPYIKICQFVTRYLKAMLSCKKSSLLVRILDLLPILN